MITWLVIATLFVAYANGANDNFKGVATLFGSGVANYRQAITLATVATVAGCVASVFLAAELVRVFSGKGLVPDAVAASPHFVLAVAVGAGCTIVLATLLALPISTTHALTGALVGAGSMAAGDALNLRVLGTAFFLPLLLSPLVAMLLAMLGHQGLRRLSVWWGPRGEPCLCIGEGTVQSHASLVLQSTAMAPIQRLMMTTSVSSAPACRTPWVGAFWRVTAFQVMNLAHGFSAAALCFARGLNDTPKIVALLLVVQAMDVRWGMLGVASAMAVGGLVQARKVADTMSHRLASMSGSQALSANVVSSLLVIAASKLGLPVSTTHVCVGAITGLGVANGTARFGVLRAVALSWVLTLPIAALVAGVVWWLLQMQ